MKKIYKFRLILCIIVSVGIGLTVVSCSDSNADKSIDGDVTVNLTEIEVSVPTQIESTESTSDSQLESFESILSPQSDTSENKTPSQIQTPNYNIFEEDGSYYLVFLDSAQVGSDGECQVATVDFETMKEFKDTVTKGQLENWQMEIIATAFPKNERGILTCDFNNLYEPVLPAGGCVTRVGWRGESYGFSLQLDKEVYGYLNYYTTKQYESIYQEYFVNLFDRDTITVTNIEQTDNGQKIVTYYRTWAGEFKRVRYTLNDGTKNITVDKTYRLKICHEGLSTSDTVPSEITLYCQDGSACYIIDLYGLTQDPSDEWLCGLGMKPYVDLEAAEK